METQCEGCLSLPVHAGSSSHMWLMSQQAMRLFSDSDCSSWELFWTLLVPVIISVPFVLPAVLPFSSNIFFL